MDCYSLHDYANLYVVCLIYTEYQARLCKVPKQEWFQSVFIEVTVPLIVVLNHTAKFAY